MTQTTKTLAATKTTMCKDCGKEIQSTYIAFGKIWERNQCSLCNFYVQNEKSFESREAAYRYLVESGKLENEEL